MFSHLGWWHAQRALLMIASINWKSEVSTKKNEPKRQKRDMAESIFVQKSGPALAVLPDRRRRPCHLHVHCTTLLTDHGVQIRTFTYVLINKIFERKNVNIFLPISFNICFGCLKEPSYWDGSFVYPQHMFWLRNKKISFWYAPFTKVLFYPHEATCLYLEALILLI